MDGKAPWPNVPADLAGVNARYHACAGQPEPWLGMPCDAITPRILIFAHTSVHDALFEDENYWKSHMNVLKRSVFLLGRQHRKENQA